MSEDIQKIGLDVSGRVVSTITALQRWRWRLGYQRSLWAWLLVAPTLFVLALIAGWPLLRTFYYSFTDANLLAVDEGARWVGLRNYLGILNDPDWWQSVRNTVFFTVVSVSLETILGLVVALALNLPFRGRSILRAAVLVPWAIPTVISAKMWSWMYNDLYGVINEILLSAKIMHARIAWIAEDAYTMGAIIAVDVWKTTPFMALLILAGLQTIPKEVIEAARLDSNSPVRTFFRVTLPLLRHTLVVAIIFRALDALRIFDLFYVLTGNKNSTATMAVYTRQRIIDFQEFGYGSAASILIFAIIGILTLLYLWMVRPARSSEA